MLPVLPIININYQSAFAKASSFAKAFEDEKADKLEIGNIGVV